MSESERGNAVHNDESTLPDKPTSGSWLTDLYALADMGATSVDIKTALGAVDEALRGDE